MDCQQIEFSSEKSQERIDKILQIFPHKLLMHILAFALHLMGAKRKQIAACWDVGGGGENDVAPGVSGWFFCAS